MISVWFYYYYLSSSLPYWVRGIVPPQYKCAELWLAWYCVLRSTIMFFFCGTTLPHATCTTGFTFSFIYLCHSVVRSFFPLSIRPYIHPPTHPPVRPSARPPACSPPNCILENTRRACMRLLLGARGWSWSRTPWGFPTWKRRYWCWNKTSETCKKGKTRSREDEWVRVSFCFGSLFILKCRRGVK